MKMWQSMLDLINYLYEGATRIFSPSDNTYPVTGIQPFEGTPYKDSGWKD